MSTRKALERRGGAVELTRPATSAAASALALIFLPKCPLCLAAYLIGFGISASAAQCAALFVRPAAWALAAVALLALAAEAWRRQKRAATRTTEPARTTCCARP